MKSQKLTPAKSSQSPNRKILYSQIIVTIRYAEVDRRPDQLRGTRYTAAEAHRASRRQQESISTPTYSCAPGLQACTGRSTAWVSSAVTSSTRMLSASTPGHQSAGLIMTGPFTMTCTFDVQRPRRSCPCETLTGGIGISSSLPRSACTLFGLFIWLACVRGNQEGR